MSAHEFTPGPWSFAPSIPEEGYECFWIENGVQRITAVDGPQTVEREANARLMSAAPELLEAMSRRVENAEQHAFEDWLARTAPSGDIEQVQYQWEGSSDFSDFCDEWEVEHDLIAKATGA